MIPGCKPWGKSESHAAILFGNVDSIIGVGSNCTGFNVMGSPEPGSAKGGTEFKAGRVGGGP